MEWIGMKKDPGISNGLKSGPLVEFYRNRAPNHSGHMISEIRKWNIEKLEIHHDYIQWLFPLRKRTEKIPGIPVLDNDQINVFQNDSVLKREIIKSLEIMLKFFGLMISREDGRIQVKRSHQWEKRKHHWLRPGNHNYWRISRILESLVILGLKDYSEAFFDELTEVFNTEDSEIIGQNTYGFWKQAVGKRKV